MGLFTLEYLAEEILGNKPISELIGPYRDPKKDIITHTNPEVDKYMQGLEKLAKTTTIRGQPAANDDHYGPRPVSPYQSISAGPAANDSSYGHTPSTYSQSSLQNYSGGASYGTGESYRY